MKSEKEKKQFFEGKLKGCKKYNCGCSCCDDDQVEEWTNEFVTIAAFPAIPVVPCGIGSNGVGVASIVGVGRGVAVGRGCPTTLVVTTCVITMGVGVTVG